MKSYSLVVSSAQVLPEMRTERGVGVVLKTDWVAKKDSYPTSTSLGARPTIGRSRMVRSTSTPSRPCGKWRPWLKNEKLIESIMGPGFSLPWAV